MFHADLFWKEYEVDEDLQLAVLKFIRRHKLNEKDSITLIENIKNDMAQARKSLREVNSTPCLRGER